MALIERMRVPWTGGPVVGDGLTTFHFTLGAIGKAAGVAAFFDAIKNQFPSPLTWSIPNTGDMIEDTTGALSGTWTEGSPASVVATGAASFYVQGVGARVKWRTSSIVGGRRVVGSTFLAPVLGEKFSGSGAITEDMRSAFALAASDLLEAVETMVIWSRPTSTRAGDSYNVVSAEVPDKVSWLRSRRV